ncbi:MAG: LPXTG cell wall anchor domain-containing protein [Streptococcus parasanguinis]
MFQKDLERVSEMDPSTKEVTSQSSPSLPNTGQENEQTGMVGLMVLLLTFGAIRLKKNRPDQG